MKLNEILRELPKLTQGELATVRAAVDHLLDGRATDTVDITLSLYEVVSNAAGRGYLSYYLFQKMPAYKIWQRDATAVVQFIEQTFPRLPRVTQKAIMSFLVSALVDDLKMLKVPITLGTIIRNISRLPQELDKCFPGYVESGLTHLIVKAMERK